MLKRGSVVVSTHGRDKNGIMAVWQVTPDGVWVVDGRRRPISRPKRKNHRHVQPVGSDIGESSMATNRELRRALTAAAENRACKDT